MSETKAVVAVLDTHVWLDWLLFHDPRVDPLRAAVRQGRLTPLACGRCRDELVAVLARPGVIAQAHAAHARRGTSPPSARDAIERFDAHSSVAPAAAACALICSDLDDQHLIDLAVAQRAQWLFTRDRALIALARRAATRYGVSIAPPERFGHGAPASLASPAPAIDGVDRR